MYTHTLASSKSLGKEILPHNALILAEIMPQLTHLNLIHTSFWPNIRLAT